MVPLEDTAGDGHKAKMGAAMAAPVAEKLHRTVPLTFESAHSERNESVTRTVPSLPITGVDHSVELRRVDHSRLPAMPPAALMAARVPSVAPTYTTAPVTLSAMPDVKATPGAAPHSDAGVALHSTAPVAALRARIANALRL